MMNKYRQVPRTQAGTKYPGTWSGASVWVTPNSVGTLKSGLELHFFLVALSPFYFAFSELLSMDKESVAR